MKNPAAEKGLEFALKSLRAGKFRDPVVFGTPHDDKQYRIAYILHTRYYSYTKFA
jgi:hypothetical protein